MAEFNGNAHLKYIEKYLIPKIVAKLENESLETYEAEHSGGLDGFMSALYNIKLKTNTPDGIKDRLLIAKFMKGDNAFREGSKSYIQFANEIYIYAKVLPEYKRILKEANITSISVEDWVAPAYVAEFGYVEGLSTSPTERESVLVLENLKPHGYKLGPRLYLNRDHLLSMCKPIGQYHALSYFLRLRDESKLDHFKNGIVPLPFINDDDPNDAKNNLYRVLYRAAFDRFFDFYDRKIDSNIFDKKDADDLKLIESLGRLREKYFAEPTRLMERIRTEVEECEKDRRFALILHGDYNRNNVLFRYKEQGSKQPSEGEVGVVRDVKMIDFQELRYGTPTIDLAFFMYMNSTDAVRSEVWMDILKEYHSNMFQTLATILKANNANESVIAKDLEKYSFANFYAHFSRYAFYGVMICLHFLPWILCSEEECARMSHLFETDMHGEEFSKLSIEAGGDEVNLRLLEIMRHACKMGYMDHI